VEIGLALPQFDYAVGPGRRLEWDSVVVTALAAERAGFGSIWLADHLFLGIEKYGGPPGFSFGYDPIVALAALARQTTTVRLGILVLCAQLRPPRLAVRQLDTLQELSGGRLVPGVGAGWFEPEYTAAGISFERPGVRLRQMADLLDLLGEWGLPRWAGGRGDRFLDVVANHADGWNTVWAWTPSAYKERLDVLERACERIGRDPAEITRSLGLTTLVGEDRADLERRFQRLRAASPPGVITANSVEEWKDGRLVGTVEEVRAHLERWSTLGVSVIIAGLGALPFSATDPDDLELLASALL